MTDSSTTSMGVELHAGDLRLAVRPDLGASVAGLWLRGEPVLRSSEPGALSAARQAACYPLVPYSNRIAHRRFRWQGKDHTTVPNFDDSPHSLHGVGWRRPWSVVGHSESYLELHYAHEPDADWPFAFDVRHAFTLTAASLHLKMVLTNTSAAVQPTGLGWHPYFVKRQRSHVHADIAARWDPDAEELPFDEVPQAAIDGNVAQLRYDHCFSGWTGQALLEDERLQVEIASNLDHLVVYTPDTKPYFCVEPVSHLSNAIHMTDPLAHGLRALAPGDMQEADMTLAVSAT